MSIDDTVVSTIEDCAHRSHAGTIAFGEVVERLVAAGVESYRADYRGRHTTYYLPDGATHAVALPAPDLAIADAFDAAGVREAVRGAQRGAVVYPQFLRLTMAAGCVGYHVWIAGRHVVYHGRRGETYVEPFPGAPPPGPEDRIPVRAHVAVVQGVYAAFARGDLAAALALMAPNIEIVQSSEVPWGGRYVGHEGARAFFARLTGAVRSSPSFERFIDAGDAVVALGRTRGTTVVGDRPFDVPLAHLWTVRDGLVARVHFCVDNPAILAALA